MTSPIVLHDILDPARAGALEVMLGRTAGIKAGTVLPPFFHQVYFWHPAPASALGADGHPAVGGDALIPDLGLPRRMWAGGALRFEAELRAGIPAQKTSQLVSAERKQGRSGPLAFVRLRHEIRQDGALCVIEDQDLVYREAARPGAQPPAAPEAPAIPAETPRRTFGATDLFRYSALTFNGHRIHYDIDYAREQEGYAGLVVHGPLLAQVLMLLAEARLGRLSSFRFRATAPLIAGEGAAFHFDGGSGVVRGPGGRLCMTAEAA